MWTIHYTLPHGKGYKRIMQMYGFLENFHHLHSFLIPSFVFMGTKEEHLLTPGQRESKCSHLPQATHYRALPEIRRWVTIKSRVVEVSASLKDELKGSASLGQFQNTVFSFYFFTYSLQSLFLTFSPRSFFQSSFFKIGRVYSSVGLKYN